VPRRDGGVHSCARWAMGASGARRGDRAGVRRRWHRSDLVGSLPRARCRSFRAIACGESRRAVDVARGLGPRRDSNRLTIIAIAWCVATFPILFIVPHRAIRSADYFAIPSLIFPFAGVVMIAWAMRLRRRIREYGESRFAMDSVPGQIGGSLAGSIHVDKPPAAGKQVALELACINRTTRGTWHNLTTWDWILWRAEQTSMSDSTGSIPVAFLIASDCRPTDDSNPESRIVWRLRAKAPGAAGGYRAEFEVPVFQIGVP